MGALSGLTVLCIAQNLPGPATARELMRDGAQVLKIEPPAGDFLLGAAPDWYRVLNDGFQVQRIDLRDPAGWADFVALMQGADLLISSHRRGALARLGLTPGALAELAPNLCWVEIVGDETAPDVPGHDLTYQAEAGLLSPPAMPRSLLADMGGVARATQAALTLLMGRERGDTARHRAVGLRQSAEWLAEPLHLGLTAPGGFLSGVLPEYRIYPLADGWVAAAAMEAHFAARFHAALGADPAAALAGMTRDQVTKLAEDQDIPLVAFQN